MQANERRVKNTSKRMKKEAFKGSENMDRGRQILKEETIWRRKWKGIK